MTKHRRVNPSEPSDARALLELGLLADGDEALLMDAVMDRLPGLEIMEVLGQGGMGVVYLARQHSLDRLVAVKVLNPELARRPEFAARFEQEARTLATLRHPGIVTVHDVGKADGLYFIIMEHVQGHNARAELTDPMRPGKVAATLTAVCDVLSYSHSQGIIHRDIKPENILVDPYGQIKVADFGLAKLVLGQNISLTSTLANVGTLPYMAPEQIEGRPDIDARTDVYAVGVLAFEMLTTTLPVGRFGPPSAEGAIGAQLDGVVMRCLERDPDKRFSSMEELRQAITQAVAGGPGLIKRSPKRKRINEPRAIAAFASFGLVGLLALGIVAAADEESHRRPAGPTEPERSDVRECLTVRGETTCGYNCKAAYGQAICADNPLMDCVADYGQLKCGYGCASGNGRIECADAPGQACMAGDGASVACGYDCQLRDGGVVCKTEDPNATARAPEPPPTPTPTLAPTPPQPPQPPQPPEVVVESPPWEAVATAGKSCKTIGPRLADCDLSEKDIANRIIKRLEALADYPDRIATEEDFCAIVDDVLDEAGCPA